MKYLSITLLIIALAIGGCANDPAGPADKQIPPEPNLANGFTNIELDEEANALDTNMGWQVGKLAPEFRWQAGGKWVSIHDYHGWVVVLQIWSTTCGACYYQAPYWVDLWQPYRESDMVFIAYSLDHVYDEWVDFVRSREMNWINIADGRGWNNSVLHYYNIGFTPNTVIIDKTGRIRYRGVIMAMDFDAIMEELLAE
ncbi:MAG: peroxiredoxin family protein [Candidatus Kapaibacterium sp.]